MDDDSPELAAIKEMHKQFQRLAGQSLEQGLQLLSMVQVQIDLLKMLLMDRGYSQEQIEELVAKRSELAHKYYRKNAEFLSQAARLALEDEDKPPM